VYTSEEGARKLLVAELKGTSNVLARYIGPSKVLEDRLLRSF
jgi:hypothetical protein